MQEMLAVIMGGGEGKRLFPLTLYRSKPAVPLAGKYRLIDIPISNCINSNINRMFVLTQFNSASLNRHIAMSYTFDRFSKGFVTILAAEQTYQSRDWYQGTADAVRHSLHYINAYWHKYVLILSGDQLYQLNYREMLRHHMENNAEITIGTIPVTAEEAPAFGILKTDARHNIVEFHEKPPKHQLPQVCSKVSPELAAQGRIYLANMGIYIFNHEVLNEELASPKKYTDFGKELIPDTIGRRRLVSFPFSGYWSDIGTVKSFFEANIELTKENPPFDFYNPKMLVYTRGRMLSPTRLDDCSVHDSLITEGCIINKSHISDSVIGIRSVIHSGTTLKRCIDMGADFYPWQEKEGREQQEAPDDPSIGEGSYIEGTIIDKNVKIGRNCVIRNERQEKNYDGPNYYIRDGVIVLPKNTVIPDGTII
jgi:glucose-1-phosphate adenylyltransferase